MHKQTLHDTFKMLVQLSASNDTFPAYQSSAVFTHVQESWIDRLLELVTFYRLDFSFVRFYRRLSATTLLPVYLSSTMYAILMALQSMVSRLTYSSSGSYPLPYTLQFERELSPPLSLAVQEGVIPPLSLTVRARVIPSLIPCSLSVKCAG